jgi:hypothetical protein
MTDYGLRITDYGLRSLKTTRAEESMSQTYFGAIDGVSAESRKRASDETKSAISQTSGKTACRWVLFLLVWR